MTQNGYTYANNNPVMLLDPDGHYVWLAANAGFAAYNGFKAYKAGKKGWKLAGSVAWPADSGFVKVGYLNKVGKVVNFSNKNKLLSKNPKYHKSRVNTDIVGSRAVAKSLFRHHTKKKNVTQVKSKGVIRRLTKDNSFQISMYNNGKTNLDIKRNGKYKDDHLKK